MAAWNRKTLKILINFCVFWKNDHYGKIFKILFRKFSSRHRLTCYVQMSWNLADRKSVKSCVAWQKYSPRSPTVATALIAPKIYRGQLSTMYLECSGFYPTRFTFGGVIAERVNTAKTRRKVNPIFGWSLASSRMIKCFLITSAITNEFVYRWKYDTIQYITFTCAQKLTRWPP